VVVVVMVMTVVERHHHRHDVCLPLLISRRKWRNCHKAIGIIYHAIFEFHIAPPFCFLPVLFSGPNEFRLTKTPGGFLRGLHVHSCRALPFRPQNGSWPIDGTAEWWHEGSIPTEWLTDWLNDKSFRLASHK